MNQIHVVVRLRPEKDELISKGLQIDEKANTINLSLGETQYDFPFDQILNQNCSQERLFSSTGVPIINQVLNGSNGTCLTYGQTGAGKTFTMTGPNHDFLPHNEGLVIRSARYLFQQARRMRDVSISMKFSVIEIYNETLIDLLRDITTTRQISPHTSLPPIVPNMEPGALSTAPSSSAANNANKLVLQETLNGVIVQNLCMIPINFEDEVVNYLSEVHRCRAISEHLLNKSSSRSHVMYAFHITRSKTNGGEEDIIVSKLNLVDLAGSERVEKTGTSGQVQKEASYINKSLTFLEQVVLALSQSKRDHIPFRQSKLTMLLKDSLGSSCHTLLIACIWPSCQCEYETLSTLRFATRMKCIENHPTRNSLIGKDSAANHPAKLRAQINYLRREIQVRDLIIESSKQLGAAQGHHSKEYGSQQRKQFQGAEEMKDSRSGLSAVSLAATLATEKPDPQHLLRRPTEDYCIESMAQLDKMFAAFRNFLWEACDQDYNRVQAVVQRSLHRMQDHHHHRASPTISPMSSDALLPLVETIEVSNTSSAFGSEVVVVEDTSNNGLSYEEFIQGPGKLLNDSYFAAKETVKSNKQRQKEIIIIINRQKQLIDELSIQIRHIADDLDVEDSDHVKVDELLLSKLNLAKQEYLAARKELDMCKDQLQEAESLKKTIMSTLLKTYEDYSLSVIT
jgi:hypothetical protein